MAEKVEIKFYKIDNITQATTKNSLFAVKADSDNTFKLYVTDLDGNLIPLFTSSGSGGGVTNLISTDSSILITGSAVKDLKLSTALKNLINSALQSGDFISTLANDAGYLTLADLPTFNPSDYDLEDFTNSSADPFVRQSEVGTGSGANLAYTPSPTNGTVTSDSGTDATIPLADATNAGLLTPTEKSEIATAVQPSDLGVVATSNDYTDLDNIPTTFTPSSHTHVEADITDLDKYTQLETDNLLNNKVDKITGKSLSTEDYTTIEKSKLASITEIFTTALKSAYDGAKSNIDSLLLTGARLINSTEITKLSNTSGTNSGDNATNTTSNAYADAKVEDAIVNGVTTKAPSQNAVFDALALKIGQAVATNTSNTSTIVGWSSFIFKIIVEYDFGNGFVFVDYFIQGISNSPSTSFTLINNNSSFQRKETTVGVQNNGIVSNTNGLYVINTNSNVVSFFINNTESTFTGSNQKSIRGNFIYYKG